jgi:hypothetical protein
VPVLCSKLGTKLLVNCVLSIRLQSLPLSEGSVRRRSRTSTTPDTASATASHVERKTREVLRQCLYFCTIKARKLSTCYHVPHREEDAEVLRDVRLPDARKERRENLRAQVLVCGWCDGGPEERVGLSCAHLPHGNNRGVETWQAR